MLKMKPSRIWSAHLGAPATHAVAKAPFSIIALTRRLLGLSPRTQSRRATDAMGHRPLAMRQANHRYHIQPQSRSGLHVTFQPDMMPEASLAQLEGLHSTADEIMADFSRFEQEMGTLEARLSSGAVQADLRQTADQSFAGIDAAMGRWNQAAQELEQKHANPGWQAPNGHSPALRRHARIRPEAQPATRPMQPPPVLASRRLGMQLGLPHQRRARLIAFNARPGAALQRAEGLRQQFNLLHGQPRQGSRWRQIALARLASLNGVIDSRANELHDQRQQVQTRLEQRKDRRRSPRPLLAAPALKPKFRGKKEG